MQFSHNELIEILAKKTAFVMERVHLSKTEGASFEELEELRRECHIFVEEVTQDLLSLHAAYIKLHVCST
jgi:hypothetical protein